MARPTLTIAGPYSKRIAWGPIWVGIRIITIIVINAGLTAPAYVECTLLLYMEKKEEDGEGMYGI